MTKALPLAPLGVYFITVPLMAAGGDTITATCTPGNTVITKVNAAGSINVQCPSGFKMLLTYKASVPPSKAPILTVPTIEHGFWWRVNDVCAGASWVRHDDGSGCRLEIPQLPLGPTKFYFPCKKGSLLQEGMSDVYCYIGIDVAAAESSGENICATEGGQIHLSIEKANDPLSFICRGGTELYPIDREKVYDASCTKEVALLEEAALTEEDERYKLTVQKLPAERTEICYHCIGEYIESKCEVRIAVSESEELGAASGSVAAPTAAALGLTLAAVGFCVSVTHN